MRGTFKLQNNALDIVPSVSATNTYNTEYK